MTLSRTERLKRFLEKIGFVLDKGWVKFRQMGEGRQKEEKVWIWHLGGKKKKNRERRLRYMMGTFQFPLPTSAQSVCILRPWI